MSINDFKNKVNSLFSYIGFEYNGLNCGIDPLNTNHFDMWYGDDYHKAGSIDEVMEYPLFNGKSLKEIYDDITNIDY